MGEGSLAWVTCKTWRKSQVCYQVERIGCNFQKIGATCKSDVVQCANKVWCNDVQNRFIALCKLDLVQYTNQVGDMRKSSLVQCAHQMGCHAQIRFGAISKSS